ncbi:MAG: creatininase family protein [Planctomycetota bacterium]
MIRKVEEMTPAEFQRALMERPVVILPTGILEWHADHLPLGLDALKMRGIAERLAERTGALLLPQQWFGVVGYDEMRGTATFSKELVKAMAKEWFANIEKWGARVAVFVTGHYGPYQVETVKEAAGEYAADHELRIIAQPDYEGVTMPGGEQPCDHAGKWETSLALALFPELVRMEEFKRELPIPDDYPPRENAWDYRSPTGTWSYDEDLRQTADARLGEEAVTAMVEHLARRIEEELGKA